MHVSMYTSSRLLLLLVVIVGSLVGYCYLNLETHVADLRSLEIYAGPVGTMGVNRTTVFISIPDRIASITFDFTFSELVPCTFVISLPFSIIKNDRVYMPNVSIPSGSFVWSESNTSLSPRASVEADFDIMRVAVWKIIYVPHRTDFWKDKGPYHDSVKVDGVIPDQPISDKSYSSNYLTMNIFASRKSDIPSLGAIQGWPLYFWKSGTFVTSIELDDDYITGSQTVPSSFTSRVSGTRAVAEWNLTSQFDDRINTDQGIQLRLEEISKSKQQTVSTFNTLFIGLILGSVIVPALIGVAKKRKNANEISEAQNKEPRVGVVLTTLRVQVDKENRNVHRLSGDVDLIFQNSGNTRTTLLSITMASVRFPDLTILVEVHKHTPQMLEPNGVASVNVRYVISGEPSLATAFQRHGPQLLEVGFTFTLPRGRQVLTTRNIVFEME